MVARVARLEPGDPGVGTRRILRLALGDERLDPESPGPSLEILVAAARQGDGLVSKRGEDSSSFSLKAPSFPEAGKSETVSSDTIPTYAYNWCVSPLTPMGVSGVIWVPSESNIGEDPSQYAAELEIYAKSLPNTYAKESVQFLYAQPANSLVKDITVPMIPGAKSTSFDQWPKSLKNIAIELAELAE